MAQKNSVGKDPKEIYRLTPQAAKEEKMFMELFEGDVMMEYYLGQDEKYQGPLKEYREAVNKTTLMHYAAQLRIPPVNTGDTGMDSEEIFRNYAKLSGVDSDKDPFSKEVIPLRIDYLYLIEALRCAGIILELKAETSSEQAGSDTPAGRQKDQRSYRLMLTGEDFTNYRMIHADWAQWWNSRG